MRYSRVPSLCPHLAQIPTTLVECMPLYPLKSNHVFQINWHFWRHLMVKQNLTGSNPQISRSIFFSTFKFNIKIDPTVRHSHIDYVQSAITSFYLIVFVCQRRLMNINESFFGSLLQVTQENDLLMLQPYSQYQGSFTNYLS